MFDTYAGLLSEIDNWLGNRVELQAQYPAFVMLAEQRMYATLRCREMQQRAAALLTEEYEFLPYDCLELIAVSASPGEGSSQRLPLTGMTAQQMNRVYSGYPAQATTATGLPEAYSVHGVQIRFAPPPSPVDLPEQVVDARKHRHFEMLYYARFPRLGLNTPSNIILERYPDIYLFGSLIEAEPYLIDDDRTALWKTMFDAAVTRAGATADTGRFATMTVGAPT